MDASHFSPVNPYTSRGPVRSAEMFFGRADLLREIAEFLKGNQSVSLVGPRKIGKTSLLFQLMRPALGEALGIADNRLFCYLDGEVMGDDSPAEVLCQFAAEIHAEWEARGAPEEPALSAACESPSRLSFEAAIRALGKRGYSVVLLLDEFERLSANTRLDVNFFNALRSMAGRYKLAFVTSSASPLIDLTFSGRSQEILSSPFFNIFAPAFLGPLAEDESQALIWVPSERAGRSFPQPLQEFLMRYAGGHPFYLQVASFHAFDSQGAVDETERRAAQELQPHLEYAWRNLTPAQQKIALDAPAGRLPATSTPTDQAALRELERKGILTGRSGRWSHAGELWTRFLESQTTSAGTATPGPARPMAGPYELLESIGKGGMAEVYKARHTRLDRPAAVKILSPHLASESDFRERFEREARAVASLKHPNIIQVYDFGDADGLYYMAMEYIAGRDLGQRLAQSGRLPLAQIWWIAADVAAALDFAHAHGVIHRDVKPSNVMLEPVARGEKAAARGTARLQRAVLTDFGIAKLLSDATKTTQTGMFGTVEYMSPEQIRMDSTVDGRADLYAMGVLLFEMLTGRLPFTGSHPNQVMMAHLETPAPDARLYAPELPEKVASSLLRVMAKNPADRFATAREFLKALK